MNEPGMKFCGMCGTRIERRTEDRRGIQRSFARSCYRKCAIAASGCKTQAISAGVAVAEKSDEAPVALPRSERASHFSQRTSSQ